MKPAVPWSVKGIEPEARAAAKSAARQAGMTLGQWLNQVILGAEDGQDPTTSAEFAEHRLGQAQPGDAEMSKLHDSLSEMTGRFDEVESKHKHFMESMGQALSGVSSRLDGFEEEEVPSLASTGLETLQTLQTSHDAVLQRIEGLEQAAIGKSNLGALENALGQVVSHIETSDKKSLAGLHSMEQALSHMVKRLETIEEEERSSSELISIALHRLDQRIDNKEEVNLQRIATLEDTLGGMKDRLGEMERRTSESASTIRQQLQSLIETLEKTGATSTLAQESVQENEHPFEVLANRIAAIEQKISTLADLDSQDTSATESQEEAIRSLKEIADVNQHRFVSHTDEESLDQEANSLLVEEEARLSQEAPGNQVLGNAALATSVPDSFATSAISKLDFEPEDSDEAETFSELLDAENKDWDENEEDDDDADDIPSILKADLRRAADPEKKQEESREDATPLWLRNVKETIVEPHETKKRRLGFSSVISILVLAFMVMAVAAYLILAQNNQDKAERPSMSESLQGLTGPATDLFNDSDPAAAKSPNSQETVSSDSQAARGVKASATTTGPPSSPSKAAPSTQAQTLSDLQQAALNGDKRAQYSLAVLYLTGTGVERDPETAAFLLRQSSEQGFAPAQYRYGVLFERGLGVQRDTKMALGWYEAASLLGHLKAMYNLAVLYAQGNGAEQNFSKAANWFDKAAQHGLTDAQFNLAVLYLQGKGVKQDLITAYLWFSLAGTDGDQEAIDQRMDLEKSLSATDLATAKAMVVDWSALPVDLVANGQAIE